MKCENCGKNEVSFVYRSSINGRTEEHHLCQACAEKLGYTQKLFNRRPSMRTASLAMMISSEISSAPCPPLAGPDEPDAGEPLR